VYWSTLIDEYNAKQYNKIIYNACMVSQMATYLRCRHVARGKDGVVGVKE